MLALKRSFDLDASHLGMKNIQIKAMKSDIKESLAGKFYVWLLLFGLMAGQAVAQQKVVVIQSEQDVIDGSVYINPPGNKGQMMMAPLVPSGTPEKPDIYSMTYFVSGTNRLRNLIFTFDRSDKFVGYDEVALGDGRVLANPPYQQIPAMGRFGETHLLSMADATFEKVQKEGMTLTWRKKGKKSASTTFKIPAYFFTGFNKRVEKMLGIGAPVAKVEPASPYIQSGSIGKKTSTKEESKTMRNELSHLKGADLIGQVFIFMPQQPKHQRLAYTFGDRPNLAMRYAYERYVGKMVKIVSYNTDPTGKEHYGGQVEDTGELVTMEGATSGPVLPRLALKRDVDHAREKFIGKKVWLQDNAVYTYNDETDEVVPHAKPKFTEYTVQNVVLGTSTTPVRFILEDAAGNVFFEDVYISKSNTPGATAELFDFVFYDKNPRETFSDWSDEVFRLVSVGLVKQGMTKTQVTFSLGSPESVTTSELGDIKLEIWHYKSKVVTFNGGVVSGIDTLK